MDHNWQSVRLFPQRGMATTDRGVPEALAGRKGVNVDPRLLAEALDHLAEAGLYIRESEQMDFRGRVESDLAKHTE